MKWTISPMLMTAVATYGTHAATVLHHRQGRVSGARGIELVGSLIEGEPAEPQRLVHGNADGPPRAGRLQDHVAFERPGRVGARVERGAEVLQAHWYGLEGRGSSPVCHRMRWQTWHACNNHNWFYNPPHFDAHGELTTAGMPPA